MLFGGAAAFPKYPNAASHLGIRIQVDVTRCDLAVPNHQPFFSPDGCTEAEASALQLKPQREERIISTEPMCSEQATGVNNRLLDHTQGDIVWKMSAETGGGIVSGK